MMQLPRRLAVSILTHAQRAPGVEVCGLIAAKAGKPVRVIAVRNVAPEPEHRFEMDVRELVNAHKSMREQGQTLFATWHSHPDGSAELSHIDLERLGHHEAFHLVVSLGTKGVLQINGWRIVEGKPQPVDVVIVEDETA